MAGQTNDQDEIAPAVAYLFEEPGGASLSSFSQKDDIFVFQYWPENVTDSYSPIYSEQAIPGGSLPLYQYSGGGGRTISFTATFTAEVKDLSIIKGLTYSQYSVDVAAAVARLQQYLYPNYRKGGQIGVVEAPPKLVLVMPNMNLGRDQDEVLVLLKGASVEYKHWFPDGTPRVVNVAIEFSECIQRKGLSDRNNIQYVNAQRYTGVSKRYRLTSLRKPNSAIITGG